MLIIGIDPGLNRTGFGVIRFIDNQASYINSGVIAPAADLPLFKRLKILFDGVQSILVHYQINKESLENINNTQIAIEQVFVNVNPNASLLLGQARGALIAALATSGCDIFEYTALQIKKSVTGQGKAKKQDLQYMVMRLLNLEHAPSADAADALACALTHAFMHRFSNL